MARLVIKAWCFLTLSVHNYVSFLDPFEELPELQKQE